MSKQVLSQNEYIFQLQTQADKYAQLIKNDKEKIKEITKEIELADIELKEARKKRHDANQSGGGINAVKLRLIAEQRDITKLENRYESVKARECNINVQNEELKKQVDALRDNATINQGLFIKGQKQLQELHDQMNETFRRSTVVMAERDKLVAAAAEFCDSFVKDYEQHDQIYEKLTRIVQTSKENAEAFQNVSLRSAEESPDDANYVRGEITLENEAKIRSQVHELNNMVQDDKKNIQTIEEDVSLYRKCLDELQSFAGVNDYEKIIEGFTRLEEENFALYKYIQSVRDELEQIDNWRCTIEKERNKFTQEMQEGRANIRKRLIESLQTTKNKILKESEEYEKRHAVALKGFQPIARSVDKLYVALGCNEMFQPASASQSAKESISEHTNNNGRHSLNDVLAVQGVTESNIIHFLAMIEQRVIDLSQKTMSKVSAKEETTMQPKINTPSPVKVSSESAIRPELAVQSYLSEFNKVLSKESEYSKDKDSKKTDEENVAMPANSDELRRQTACTPALAQLRRTPQ